MMGRRRRGRTCAAAGAGAAAAAATAGLVVDGAGCVRTARRGATAEELGWRCAATPTRCVADDGSRCTPRSTRCAVTPATGDRRRTRRSHRRVRARLRAEPRLLALPAGRLPRQARMVFYDQRSHGRSGPLGQEHATIDQLGQDLRQVLDALVARRAGRPRRPLDGRHVDRRLRRAAPRGVRRRGWPASRLISTTAGGLRRTRSSAARPRRLGRQVPSARWSPARTRRSSTGCAGCGSNIGLPGRSRSSRSARTCPPSYVEFLDTMLAPTPFEVLAQFFPQFDLLDKFPVARGVRPGADHDHRAAPTTC